MIWNLYQLDIATRAGTINLLISETFSGAKYGVFIKTPLFSWWPTCYDRKNSFTTDLHLWATGIVTTPIPWEMRTSWKNIKTWFFRLPTREKWSYTKSLVLGWKYEIRKMPSQSSCNNIQIGECPRRSLNFNGGRRGGGGQKVKTGNHRKKRVKNCKNQYENQRNESLVEAKEGRGERGNLSLNTPALLAHIHIFMNHPTHWKQTDLTKHYKQCYINGRPILKIGWVIQPQSQTFRIPIQILAAKFLREYYSKGDSS